MIRSDAAILILNFYPPLIVKRAVDSVVHQDFDGTWTIYLGFHARSMEHKAAVKEQFQGLPVEYVDIDRDLVSDTRAKNEILKEALRRGSHRYLFFLDDDDEWHPDYLRKMTTRCDGFVTCGKEILSEDTGSRRIVPDDIDYEGMGFSFDLWKDRELPWFVKQLCDKYILRDFSARFPGHTHIKEPLYTIHQHGSSLTYTLAMGRSAEKDAGSAIRRIGVVVPESGAAPGIRQIGQVPEIRHILPGRLTEDLPFDAVIAEPAVWESCRERHEGVLKVAYAETYGQLLRACRSGADAVLPAEPLWIRHLPADTPAIPVGVPCAASVEDVKKNLRDRAEMPGSVRRRFYIAHRERRSGEAAGIQAGLPAGWEECTDRLAADVWIDLTEENGDWCPGILQAFVSGIPCISYPWSSAHRILFGCSGLAIGQPEDAGMIMASFNADRQRELIAENCRLYSRCYEHFFWYNFLVRYLEEAGKQLRSG